MAIDALSTPAGVTKHATARFPTPIMTLFADLLERLSAAIQADLDLNGLGGALFDPSCRHWLTESELLWERTHDVVAQVLASEPSCREDKPLKLACFLIHLCLQCETPSELKALHAIAERRAHFFLCPEDGQRSALVDDLVMRGLALAREIGGLACFDEVQDSETQPFNPSFAVPALFA